MTGARIRAFTLCLADIACMSLSWLLVVKAYRIFGTGTYHTTAYLNIWPILLIFTLLNAFFRLYQGHWLYPSLPLSPVEEFRRLVASISISHILVMAILGFAHESSLISRFVLVVSAVIEVLTVQMFRDAARALLAKLKIGQVRAVMVGSGATAIRVADALKDNVFIGVKLVGYFGKENSRMSGLSCLGCIRDAVRISKAMDVKIAFVCEDERLFREQMADFTSYFQQLEYIPTARLFPTCGARPIVIDGIGGLEMPNHLRMKAMGRMKSVVDRSLAIMIAMLAIPLFIIVPVLIKLTSKGPVFYRHNRLGKCGRPLRIWKFRTMYDDADEKLEELLASDPAIREQWNKCRKIHNDPRITPLGRILRKSSIDELPQLINVCMGEMALVGPRPIVEAEVPYYGEVYKIFSSVKPGITGLWQVSGRSEVGYSRRVALDANYILNWSPWLDLWIVLKSFSAVIKMRGAT